MTSAHIAPHIENLSETFSQFLGHIESGHEAPHGGVLDGINNSALHFLQLAAHVKKSFPEAERHHFYTDLNKEVEDGHKICAKFHAAKPALVAQGLKASDVVLAFEGEIIAIIAMFDSLKAADPKYEEHGAQIENMLMGMVHGAIESYSD